MWFIQVQELLWTDEKYNFAIEKFKSEGIDPVTQYFEPLQLIEAFIGNYSQDPDAIDLAIAMETYARSLSVSDFDFSFFNYFF